MSDKTFGKRLKNSILSALPSGLRTAWWLIRLTICISFVVCILNYFGTVEWLAQLFTPFFAHLGLPGESALVYISGYFVNVYAAVAVITTLDLSLRAITIISVMCLCSHNMILETTVQKKTGSSAIRIVVVRTVTAIVSGFILNYMLPAESTEIKTSVENVAANNNFIEVLQIWVVQTSKLMLRMLIFVVSLNVIQRILSEFGVIKVLSKIFSPLLFVFGLPSKTTFLWIVANTLGLAYGASVMLEEAKRGTLTKIESDLLNHHIAVFHSNLEDLLLFVAVGASAWWLLIVRLFLAFIVVWIRRFELYFKHQYRLFG